MTTQSIRWFWFSSPATFYPLAGTVAWIAGVLAAALTVAGLYVGFVVAPTDATQGEAYRIIYLHVPAAWMSMFLYVVMAFSVSRRVRELGIRMALDASGVMSSAWYAGRARSRSSLASRSASWPGRVWCAWRERRCSASRLTIRW